MFNVIKFYYLSEASLITFMLHKSMIYILLLKEFLNICLYSGRRMHNILIVSSKSKFILKI